MRDRAELLGRAAQAWCTDKTWHIEMMPELAESFADILADDLKAARLETVERCMDATIEAMQRIREEINES